MTYVDFSSSSTATLSWKWLQSRMVHNVLMFILLCIFFFALLWWQVVDSLHPYTTTSQANKIQLPVYSTGMKGNLPKLESTANPIVSGSADLSSLKNSTMIGKYSCSDTWKIEAALNKSIEAYRGKHKLAYIINLDGKSYILKTPKMKENFVRIWNLRQEKKLPDSFYQLDDGPSRYLLEIDILRRYQGPGIPFLYGFCSNPRFTWILLEPAWGLARKFIMQPSAEQSLQMVQSVVQFFDTHSSMALGPDAKTNQFVYTPDWRITLVDLDKNSLTTRLDYLKWIAGKVNIVSCTEQIDCVKHLPNIMHAHQYCDSVKCKDGYCSYIAKLVEKDNICTLAHSVMKPLLQVGFPFSVFNKCTGEATRRPTWHDLNSLLQRMMFELEALQKRTLNL